jgi:hypothetical protein
MTSDTKRAISWVVVAAGLLGVALSYVSIWVIVTTFTTSVVWHVNLALVASGPTSGIGAVIACKKPLQKLALALGIAGLTLRVALLVLCITALALRVQVTL